MKRRLTYVTALGAVAAVAGVAAFLHTPSQAVAGGGNLAVAINTQDGKSVFRVRMAIVRANGDVVTASNTAVAYASCADCQTTAIALQVVLITNAASVIQPTNLALAYNDGCSGCQTVADAYQFVRSTDGQVHFTAEGSQKLAQVRRELQELRSGDLTIAELQARLDALSGEVADVLAHDLVAAAKP